MALNNVGMTPGFNPLGGGRTGFQAQAQTGLPLRQQNFLPNQPQALGAPQAVQNQGQVSAPVSQQVPAQSLMQPPQPQQPQQAQPQFGLAGSEQVLLQGFQGAGAAINSGAQNAVQTLDLLV